MRWKGYSPTVTRGAAGPEPVVGEGFDERWAAWLERGAAHDRATRRRLFILAAILVVFAVTLNGLWL
jgi:hypothetical protein